RWSATRAAIPTSRPAVRPSTPAPRAWTSAPPAPRPAHRRGALQRARHGRPRDWRPHRAWRRRDRKGLSMDTQSKGAGSAGVDSGDAQRATLAAAVAAARAYLESARTAVLGVMGAGGRMRIGAHQRALHGLAWTATYVQAIAELAGWYDRLAARGRLGEMERHIALIGVGEYLSQIIGGIPMSQLEFARP